MGEEACFCAVKVPFLEIAGTMESPEHPSTPPLQTSASVPFKWEEQPGKPRPCSDIIPLPEPPKTLDLPPCKFTKTPSPTTVLDGPKFSSFRDSFHSFSPEGNATDLLLAGGKTRRFFGKFKREFDGGSCRFSPSSISSCHSEDSSCACARVQRNGSSHARSSHLWTTIYQGIKQVMQWKSNKKSNKQGRQ